MSYQPYSKNPSGIVFFGQHGSDPLYVSDTNFTINSGAGTEHLYSTNIRVADGGNIGSVTDPDAITIASNGDVTFSQSVSITQDLTVNGTLTTIATNNIVVEDPLMFLASGNYTTDTVDIGYFGVYDSGAGDFYAGLFRDATDTKFRLFHNLTELPTTTVNTGGVGYAVATLVANIEGNLTGNADSATALQTSRNFSVNGTNESTSNTVAFDGTANVVLEWTAQSGIITNRAELTTVDATNDYILIYDDDADLLKRINRSNFVSGLGAMSSFNITDSGGVSNVVDDGETIQFQNGTTVTFTVAANGSDWLVSGYIPDNGVTATQLNTSVAGDGLAGGGGTALSVNVDNATIEINADTLRVKDGGITEIKRSRTVDTGVTGSKTADSDLTTVNAAGGAITITLPENGGTVGAGRIMTVKKIDSSANAVTISRQTADTIDGGTTKILYNQYETMSFFCDGADWFIM